MISLDVLKYFLPEEFITHFDVKFIEEANDELIVYLDEKNIPPPSYNKNEVDSKGFTELITIQDFPSRNRKVLFKVRRRIWRLKSDGSTCKNNYNLTAKGTHYTKDFAAFLKVLVR